MTIPDLPANNPNQGGTSDGGGHISYELDAWAVESRQMLQQLLVGAGVPYVWEAGRLVIPEAFGARVDDLVDQTEATFTGSINNAADARVVFDVSDFDHDLIDAVLAALGEAGVDWALEEGGDLVVPAAFADTVEQVVENLEFPHALAVADVDGTGASNLDGDGDDPTTGVEIDPDRVLGGLFVAADRLARSATDSRGVLTMLELADELAGGAMPFGFDELAWSRMKTLTTQLSTMLTVVGSTDEEVEAVATELRDLLRAWV